MPQMASITVKKDDGIADIIYDAVSAAGGDSSPAVWRQDTGQPVGVPVGLRPVLRVLTQWNGPKSARQMKFNFVKPYFIQDSTTTVYTATDRVVLEGIITIPQAIPAGQINEAVSQGLNLLAAQLIKDSGKAGYAPT